MFGFRKPKNVECAFENAIIRIAVAAERQAASVEQAQQSAIDMNRAVEMKNNAERQLIEFELQQRRKTANRIK